MHINDSWNWQLPLTSSSHSREDPFTANEGEAKRAKQFQNWTRNIMGRKLLVCFFLLLITQCFLLVKYVVKYEGKGDIYWLFVLLFLLAIFAWLAVMIDNHIRWLGFVWLSYTLCALTPMVGWIFGSIVIENKLDSDDAFGPNSLKAILCITPVLMLLLLQSTYDPSDSSDFHDLLKELSFTVTLDLFDGIEMLEVILEEDENRDGIPKGMEIAILVFVCGFFLLSPLELLQYKYKEGGDFKIRKVSFCIKCTFQVLVNLAFLILRLILWFEHGRNAPIFIAKNGISLIRLGQEIWSE